MELINYYDTNNDGQINYGDNIEEGHLNMIMDNCDADENGQVNACEIH